MPELPDHRIRFNSELIDFENDVGTTGKLHDTFPSPGQQLRYDWWRMMLIGLLSNQSGTTAPEECREGTIWFDLNTFSFKAYKDAAWTSLSDAILLESGVTLADWYTSNAAILRNVTDKGTFSGTAAADTTSITIPSTALRTAANKSTARPFVWKNGLLQDPRDAIFGGGSPPTSIILSGDAVLEQGDKYTVVFENITPSLFYEE